MKQYRIYCASEDEANRLCFWAEKLPYDSDFWYVGSPIGKPSIDLYLEKEDLEYVILAFGANYAEFS